MTDDLALRRRLYAEDLQVVYNLRTEALVEALATVPREQFLPPGPWVIRSEGDMGGPARQTADGSPHRLYHNLAVAIDPARQLFNGAPSVVATCIDALAIRPGERVLHVGCGLGYYSALMAHCVGPGGHVTAVEVDAKLAAGARENLASMPWIEIRHGDGTAAPEESFDAILVNAGMTHPHETWLNALTAAGRLILPLTVSMEPMGQLSKGVILLFTKTPDPNTLGARLVTTTMIYSAVGIRDAALNEKLGAAFRRGPFVSFRTLRRDPHDLSPACWLHGETFCLTSA